MQLLILFTQLLIFHSTHFLIVTIHLLALPDKLADGSYLILLFYLSLSIFFYLGYIGIVKDATESTARIELHSSCKTISVDRQRLTNLRFEFLNFFLDLKEDNLLLFATVVYSDFY